MNEMKHLRISDLGRQQSILIVEDGQRTDVYDETGFLFSSTTNIDGLIMLAIALFNETDEDDLVKEFI